MHQIRQTIGYYKASLAQAKRQGNVREVKACEQRIASLQREYHRLVGSRRWAR